MRATMPDRLERGRKRDGKYATNESHGPFGIFEVAGPCGETLRIVSSGACDDADGWEHVSISTRRRTPNWLEMCFVKDLFWGEEECAVQYHPPRSEYVNNHPFCLHLFRPTLQTIPMPPSILVGDKNAGLIDGRVAAGRARLPPPAELRGRQPGALLVLAAGGLLALVEIEKRLDGRAHDEYPTVERSR